jgi:tetratricopeptide (TPR) repeat protein
MKKRIRNSQEVAIVLYLLLLVVIIGLVAWDYIQSGGSLTPSALLKAGLALLAAAVSLVRLWRTLGVKFGLYEKLYREEVGTSFSQPDQKRAKRQLIRAIAAYNEDRYSATLRRLKALERSCRTAEEKRIVKLFAALTYTEQGASAKAIDIYRAMLDVQPCDGTAWSNLGMIYRKQGRVQEAIDCYQSALYYEPENAYAWNNLATAYMMLGDYAAMIEPAKRALENDELKSAACTALCAAYYATGEKDLSEQYFDRALLSGANGDDIMRLFRHIDQRKSAYDSADASDATFGT